MDDTPPVLTLVVKKGRRGGETRQCRAGAVFRVGRIVTGNDLAVRDVGASERHLSIEFLPPPAACWAVSDLGSCNGTSLNGVTLVPTVPSPLSDGDIIKIGESTVLTVSIAPDSDPNPGHSRSTRHSAAVAVEQEKPPTVTRRRQGRPKKAAAVAEPPEAVKEEPEEAAVVTRRGARKKAAEPPKAEEHENGKDEKQEEEEDEEEVAVVTRRGGRRKAAPEAALPPPPPRPRSTRVAARRGKAVDTSGLDEGESEVVGRGRGRGKRASARKARIASPEEDAGGEQEGEVAAPGEHIGNPPRATAATNGEEEEAKLEFADGEVERNAKASAEVEEVPVAQRGRPQRAPKGRANAQRAASDNGGEKENGGGDVEEDGKKDAVGSEGEEVDGRWRTVLGEAAWKP
ncbi:hypothetical protein GUJ93_ZPchr0013g37232 [Zizania palustris]|uniref:FHA domain-containing protein n=1 Tax=Zizania palustris TaxID=103762 RepID=A0A8J5WU96_ZIZPA|nr:hypothetical protein GUJ93_ZPchr0013g37232 [Zizania palustris]